MATATINYTGPTTITLSSASLGTSSTFVAGQESTEVDNTTNKYIDALLEGFETVGTTPTVDTEIRVYVWGSHTSLGTTARDVLDGTDSAETITSEGVRDGFMKRVATMRVDSTTTDRKYQYGPISVRDIFGEVPQYWGVFVTHNTGVNLNSTPGNHEHKYTGIKYDSA